MTKKPIKLSSRDIEILISLFDPNDKNIKRTQSETAKFLNYPLYVVSRSVKRLLDGNYIRKFKPYERKATYVPHTNYNLAISQVTDDFKVAYEQRLQLIADRAAVTYPDTAGTIQEPFTLQPHKSGCMPYFWVIQEGEFETAPKRDPTFAGMVPKIRGATLTMLKRKRVFNGSEDWDGLFLLDYGRRYRLRYQRTKDKRYFYVGPQYDIESLPDELLVNINAPHDRVTLECYPVLDWLTKYAGWRFLVDENGHYKPLNKSDPANDHIQINHQPTTDFIKEHVGKFTADGVCADESKGKLRYEVKANRPDYIAALVDSPVTRELAFKHENEIRSLQGRTNAQDRSLEDVKESFSNEIFAIWLALEEVAQTTNATVKLTSALAHQSVTNVQTEGAMYG